MPGRVKKVLVGLTSFLIVAGLLFTANYFYEKIQIRQPIVDKISHIDGVESIEIASEQGKLVVQVALAPDSDVTVTWPQIVEAVAVIGDPDQFVFKVHESQTLPGDLIKASVAVELAVQESLATGAYTAIPRALVEVEEAYEVKTQVSLSRDQLLIKLADDELGRMYQIVPLTRQDRG